MSGILITVTDAGRAALITEGNTGTNARQINSIGLATTSFDHKNKALKAIPGELKRITTFGATEVAPDTLHVTLKDDTNEQYTLHGFGLYLDNGVLFAVYSQDAPIMEKSPTAIMLLSADVRFTSIDTGKLVFGPTTFLNPPASTERLGVIKLATQEETDEGRDDVRAVTPKTAAKRYAALSGATFTGPVTVHAATDLRGTVTIGTGKKQAQISSSEIGAEYSSDGHTVISAPSKFGQILLTTGNKILINGLPSGQVLVGKRTNDHKGMLQVDGFVTTTTPPPDDKSTCAATTEFVGDALKKAAIPFATQEAVNAGTDDSSTLSPKTAAVRYAALNGATFRGPVTVRGFVTATTPAASDKSTRVATTEFVVNSVRHSSVPFATQEAVNAGTDDKSALSPKTAATRYAAKTGTRFTGAVDIHAKLTISSARSQAIMQSTDNALLISANHDITLSPNSQTGRTIIQGGGADALVVLSSKKVLIGSRTDNHLGLLQINGTASAHTPSRSDNSQRIATTAFVTDKLSEALIGQVVFELRTDARPGFLKLNGSIYSRHRYPALWDYARASGALVPEARWSSTNHGCFSSGDGLSTFRLPDLRGEFIRSFDDGRGVDSGRKIGSPQNDQNQRHDHPISMGGAGHHSHKAWTDIQGWHDHGDPWPTGLIEGIRRGQAGAEATMAGSGPKPRTEANGNHRHNIGMDATGNHTHSLHLHQQGGSETRPRNIALLAMIRAY